MRAVKGVEFPNRDAGFHNVFSYSKTKHFDLPRVGDAGTLAYFLDAKYKFTPSLFGAVRWNQQFFGTDPDGAGGEAGWDRDLWRVGTVLGWRFTRHVQAKLPYSYSHQRENLPQGEQLVASQLTVRF